MVWGYGSAFNMPTIQTAKLGIMRLLRNKVSVLGELFLGNYKKAILFLENELRRPPALPTLPTDRQATGRQIMPWRDRKGRNFKCAVKNCVIKSRLCDPAERGQRLKINAQAHAPSK